MLHIYFKNIQDCSYRSLPSAGWRSRTAPLHPPLLLLPRRAHREPPGRSPQPVGVRAGLEIATPGRWQLGVMAGDWRWSEITGELRGPLLQSHTQGHEGLYLTFKQRSKSIDPFKTVWLLASKLFPQGLHLTFHM